MIISLEPVLIAEASAVRSPLASMKNGPARCNQSLSHEGRPQHCQK